MPPPVWTRSGAVVGVQLDDAVGVGHGTSREGRDDRGVGQDVGVVLADVAQAHTVVGGRGRVGRTRRDGGGDVGEHERAAVVQDGRTGVQGAGLHDGEAPVRADDGLRERLTSLGQGASQGVEQAQVSLSQENGGEVRGDGHEPVRKRHVGVGELRASGHDRGVHVGTVSGDGVVGGQSVHGGGQRVLSAPRHGLHLRAEHLTGEVLDGEGQVLVGDLGRVVEVRQGDVNTNGGEVVVGDGVTGVLLLTRGGVGGNLDGGGHASGGREGRVRDAQAGHGKNELTSEKLDSYVGDLLGGQEGHGGPFLSQKPLLSTALAISAGSSALPASVLALPGRSFSLGTRVRPWELTGSFCSVLAPNALRSLSAYSANSSGVSPWSSSTCSAVSPLSEATLAIAASRLAAAFSFMSEATCCRRSSSSSGLPASLRSCASSSRTFLSSAKSFLACFSQLREVAFQSVSPVSLLTRLEPSPSPWSSAAVVVSSLSALLVAASPPSTPCSSPGSVLSTSNIVLPQIRLQPYGL